MKESLRHPVRTLRTAPIALGGIAMSTGMSSVMARTAFEVDNNVETFSWGMAGVSALLAVRGIHLAKQSFELRDRLESSLEDRGFNERIFNTTTEDWCTRQTAIVASEKYDAVEQYDELCAQNQDGAKFTWLPHI